MHPRRPPRRPRALGVAASLLVAAPLLLACSEAPLGPYGTAPGTYRLLAVSGRGVPVQTGSNAGPVTISRGSLVLRGDGTCEVAIDGFTDTAGGRTEWTVGGPCTYEATPATVALALHDGGTAVARRADPVLSFGNLYGTGMSFAR